MHALTRTRPHASRALARALTTTPPCYKPNPPPLEPEPESETGIEAETGPTYAQLPTPRTPLSSYTLPPPKLRALIDLYHASASYITPESLDEEIDKAFAPMRYSTPVRYQSYLDLVNLRDERASEPDRVIPSANELGGGYARYEDLGTGWSSSKSERARMVKAALWGVDPMAKIGLETLLEAKAEMDAQEEPLPESESESGEKQ